MPAVDGKGEAGFLEDNRIGLVGDDHRQRQRAKHDGQVFDEERDPRLISPKRDAKNDEGVRHHAADKDKEFFYQGRGRGKTEIRKTAGEEIQAEEETCRARSEERLMRDTQGDHLGGIPRTEYKGLNDQHHRVDA